MIQNQVPSKQVSPTKIPSVDYGKSAGIFDIISRVFTVASKKSGMDGAAAFLLVAPVSDIENYFINSKIGIFQNEDLHDRNESLAQLSFIWMHEHPNSLSSLGSIRGPTEKNKQGAAIRTKDYIFSLSSTMRFLDESVLIVSALKLGQLKEGEVIDIKISNGGNKRWRELLFDCESIKPFHL